MTNDAAIQVLASHAADYRANVFTDRAAAVGADPSTLRYADETTALALVYHHYAFNRAGGSRAGYDDIATTALQEVGTIDTEQLWTVFKQECDSRGIGLNERMNKGAVRDTARLAQHHGNLFDWVGRTIESGDGLETAYATVNDISGIGEKITRFFLRDAVWICGLEDAVAGDAGQYLQPIDVWIRRTAATLWPDIEDARDDDISSRIATECRAHNVSGIAFNQGAWYYAAQHLDGDVERVENALDNISG